jgi:hypothetical protein
MAVEIPVTDEWGQGAYVMVTVHTPRDPVDQPLPRRAVGVAYVPVGHQMRAPLKWRSPPRTSSSRIRPWISRSPRTGPE